MMWEPVLTAAVRRTTSEVATDLDATTLQAPCPGAPELPLHATVRTVDPATAYSSYFLLVL